MRVTSRVQPPRLQALVLADQVYTDATTGKGIIAGTFNRLRSDSFPATFDRATFVYVSLTDVRSRAEIRLRYVDNEDLSVHMESPIVHLDAHDPLATIELVVEIPPFPMPHPGSYSLELHCNEERIGSLRLTVEAVAPEDY